MQIVIKICSIIGTVLSVLMAYKVIFAIIGVFKHKTFEKAKENHTFGICIPARNEGVVIENLLDSILNQSYPQDKLRIFVVADNCTDNTAQLVQEYKKKHNLDNLYLFEHKDSSERTKGFALKFLFGQIKEQFGIDNVEAYFIFDADNVLNKDYIEKMNDAYDAGNKIVTSFRHSKNMNQNWISFSYAMHWMRTCMMENRAKGLLNQACRIQGTGFLFDKDLVKNGWNYTSLTEDRSFCTDAVIQNYLISYQDEAVFYDEQPTDLKIAFRQRIRWSKGHLQSTVENCPKLIKNMFKKDKYFFTQYDSFWTNFPNAIESACRKIITRIMQLIIAILAHSVFDLFTSLLISYAISLAFTWAYNFLIMILVMIVYKKRVGKLPFWKTLGNMIMFPFFDIIGKWTTYIALFKKVEWKPIPHKSVVDISALETKN